MVQAYPVTDPALLAQVPDGEVLSWVPPGKGITLRLDEEALGAFVTGMSSEAFRHEVLPAYEVASDDDQVSAYLSGADRDPAVGAEWRAWIRRRADEGARLRTLRVIHEMPGDYLRYECEWGYTANAAAGMNVRILDLTEHPTPHGFLDEEFWSVDGTAIAAMRYDEAGRFLYADLVDGPAAHRHLAAQEAAWSVAEPFDAWWARHPEHHRDRRLRQ